MLTEEIKIVPHLWANEGLDIVRDYVYENIEEDESPLEDYLKRGQEIANKQIAKAGYRLAYVLKNLWTETREGESENEDNSSQMENEI